MQAGGGKMRKEKKYETEINGVPQLSQMPKELLELLCAALLDSIQSERNDENRDS